MAKAYKTIPQLSRQERHLNLMILLHQTLFLVLVQIVIHRIKERNVTNASVTVNVLARELHQNTIVTDLANVMLVMAKAIME